MPNWSEVVNEITAEFKNFDKDNCVVPSINRVRHRYLEKLTQHTGRNIIAYYSGWLSTEVNSNKLSINDNDTNGFMLCSHQLDRSKGLDLILHTPGGGVEATKAIVTYLHKLFDRDIRAIVPQLAMSAGTMIACSCNSIVMGKQSSLGPVDPQMMDIPSNLVKHEVERALREIKNDPAAVHLWQPILSKLHPTFITQCELACISAEQFLKDQLIAGMFSDRGDKEAQADIVSQKLADAKEHKSHSRHIDSIECEAMGLKIEPLEADQVFQDIVLTIHHCFMHLMENSSTVKAIENHTGTAAYQSVGE